MNIREIKQKYDAERSQVFDKYGVFFAFSDKQFLEKRKPDVAYMIHNGMVCPKENFAAVAEELGDIVERQTAELLQHRKELIHYELANYECQIVMDMREAVDVLAYYGITEEEVRAEWPEFMKNCIDNDYF